ncbi:hypothetical protein Q5P01_000534 [Channa striata]|uniref:Uncharacterized protein n=1 Tax=Channa striata TaxID=64152 RepID=A0AA88LN06_CHASR|nr:hypothetical protein Q5P01_000534 [Channa striata]
MPSGQRHGFVLRTQLCVTPSHGGAQRDPKADRRISGHLGLRIWVPGRPSPNTEIGTRSAGATLRSQIQHSSPVTLKVLPRSDLRGNLVKQFNQGLPRVDSSPPARISSPVSPRIQPVEALRHRGTLAVSIPVCQEPLEHAKFVSAQLVVECARISVADMSLGRSRSTSPSSRPV